MRTPELLKNCAAASLLLCDAMEVRTSPSPHSQYSSESSVNRAYSVFQSLLPQAVPTDSEASHVSVLGRVLLLLGRRNQDPVMREMVCDYLRDHLTDDEWILFCPQFVQALKWDLLPNNDLIRHLLCQALRDRSFAYNLYWQLQVRDFSESPA